MLAMGVGMAALPLQLYTSVDATADPEVYQRVDESAWMMVGLSASAALLMGWSATRVFRSALSLWGLSSASRPFSIPTRMQIIGSIAHAFF